MDDLSVRLTSYFRRQITGRESGRCPKCHHTSNVQVRIYPYTQDPKIVVTPLESQLYRRALLAPIAKRLLSLDTRIGAALII